MRHGELVLSALFRGNTVEDVRANVGWTLQVSDDVRELDAPDATSLRALHALQTAT
jgi:acyl CoA:acetate/3-ketoacid CoA transferase beta subunit